MRAYKLTFVLASSIKVLGFAPICTHHRRDQNWVRFSVPDPIDTLTSGLASLCRLPGGVTVSSFSLPYDKQPKLLRLYDIENNRDCRAVRERITELDLVVERVIPACSNAKAFSKEGQFPITPGTVIPCLVVIDSGMERVLSGAEEILDYLDVRCSTLEQSTSNDTKAQAISVLRSFGNYAASFLRTGRGSQVAPAANGAPRPDQPLILFSYEGGQFNRIVREVLTEWDLVYELRSAGKGSPRRQELASITGGSTQMPFLIDPNTDTQMAESADIVRYLYKNYALWQPPNELLQWASNSILPAAKPLFTFLAPLQAGSRREDRPAYNKEISDAIAKIEATVREYPVVVYTYVLSPFSSETKALLDSLDIQYKEVSLGLEWIPGLIKESGATTRAALLEMMGQSSLPNIFIGGKSIGGLFSGTPGLVPALEGNLLREMVSKASGSPIGTRIYD